MSKPTEKPRVAEKKPPVKKKKGSSKRATAIKLAKTKSKFLEYYGQLPVQKLAAAHIGKSEDTICDWKNKDKKFANQLEAAKSDWALRTSSKVKSAEWLLERILSEHFGEKIKVEENNEGLNKFMDRMAKLFPD